MPRAYYVGQVGVLVSADQDQAEQLSQALESVKSEVGALIAERLRAAGFEVVNAPSTLARKIYEEEVIDMVPRKTHLPSEEKTQTTASKGLCGNWASAKNIRENLDAVTCKLCQRKSREPDSPYHCGGCEKTFNTARGRLNHECPALKRVER